jgi:glycosyltransferase involved in cell wall biosynthesis
MPFPAQPPVAAMPTPAISVALLHNYAENRQPSMRLYADHLGDALRRRGIAVTRVRPPEIVPQAWQARSGTWAKLDNYIGRFVVYPRLVRNLVTDVVHIIDHGQGYLVAGLDPARTVVTCHDIILLALAHGRIGSAAVPPVALQLLRLSLELMKRAAAVVADSPQTKRDLVSLVGVPPERITVIAPGLNGPFAPSDERGAAFRRRRKLGEGPLVLQIGRGFYKNIMCVLRVIHRLRAGGLPVRLVRTGRALAGEERRLADQLGVTGAVIELGGVTDDELPALYNAVDLLLFPSLYEGFGWPPIEAMASGTPVVCSRTGSLNDVIGNAALTSDPENVETLAWHAATVLTDERLRGALVARGLVHAAQFNWDRTAEQVAGVYQSVIAQAA